MKITENKPCWKRYFSFKFLVDKVRENGIVWCVHTLLQKIALRLGIWLRPNLSQLWKIFDDTYYKGKRQSDVLYAFYDLMVSPATFDIVVFLSLAESMRETLGCKSLHVVVVPGSADGFRANDLKIYIRQGTDQIDISSMQWRLRNILVPCCWMIPSCQGVTVCTSRREARVLETSLAKHVYPKEYTVRFPEEGYSLVHLTSAISQGVNILCVKATQAALNIVNDWIGENAGNRKVITITLRECLYELDRNSNIKDWSAFARGLDPATFYPVIIRDIDTTLNPIPPDLEGLHLFPEIVWNVELRCALYELSYLNLVTNNGPSALCVFNQQAHFLMFKMITPTSGATTEAFFRSQGFEPGSQIFDEHLFKRYVWDNDNLEVIQREFKEMCDRIERYRTESGKLDT